MARVWEEFLSERDRKIYGAAGYGKASGFKDRPALLVVDINYAFVGDRPEDIFESVKRFNTSCGIEGWDAMEKLVPVLDAARAKGVPVIYTTDDTEHAFLDRTSWGVKNRRTRERETRPADVDVEPTAIPEMIAPADRDVVIRKKKPSAFFDTPILQYLITYGVNQILCCGTTTSGCVRASVIDAFSNNYSVAVIEDCTFDRGQAPHAINLFDMQQKYAEVISSAAVIDYLNGLPAGIYDAVAGSEP